MPSVLLNNSVPCTSVLLERDLLVGTVILLLSSPQLGRRYAKRSAWEQERDFIGDKTTLCSMYCRFHGRSKELFLFIVEKRKSENAFSNQHLTWEYFLMHFIQNMYSCKGKVCVLGFFPLYCR